MEFVSTQYDKLIFNNQMKYILNVIWLSIKLTNIASVYIKCNTQTILLKTESSLTVDGVGSKTLWSLFELYLRLCQ